MSPPPAASGASADGEGPDGRARDAASPAALRAGLEAFQDQIEAIYGARDAARGVDGTFVWFVEEVGELARALKGGDADNLREEFADVAAWLVTLASLAGVSLGEAVGKYADGCPRCHATPCACPEKRSQRVARQ